MLKEGDKAPEFSGNSGRWEDYFVEGLSRAESVLYFYPKANTPG